MYRILVEKLTPDGKRTVVEAWAAPRHPTGQSVTVNVYDNDPLTYGPVGTFVHDRTDGIPAIINDTLKVMYA